jgi:hypothetical protein
MKKSQAKTGMKVTVRKTDRSLEKGWCPSHANRHIGLPAIVDKVHAEYEAIHIKIVDPVIGESQWWWYHADDIIPIGDGSKYKKKANFDPNNLVVGV